MMNFLFVGLGGALGAGMRYGVNRLVATWLPHAKLPLATLGVNLLGCFVIGWLAAVMSQRGASASPFALFVLVGVLGGFTTYSTFALELVQLGGRGESATAVWSILLHLVGGVLAVVLGASLAR